ncbi:hypothetical protein VSP9026_03783 [Vibrio spartinae]|uniref:Uncharacterized protein n=1 Tax=Vibrio spartinae TaxID=1918945 RepID=A0A1N6M9J4_9VIBR|nr:hypothetical protein VSP9026_03783 [Vibrio spartinae]
MSTFGSSASFKCFQWIFKVGYQADKQRKGRGIDCESQVLEYDQNPRVREG